MGNLTLKDQSSHSEKGSPLEGGDEKKLPMNERPQSNSNDSKQQTTQALSSVQRRPLVSWMLCANLGLPDFFSLVFCYYLELSV